MAISKSENASQHTEHDDEIERERDERGGEFENGYGYGHDGGRELGSESEPEPNAESERGLEGDDAAPYQTTTGAVNRDLWAHDGEHDESAREAGAVERGAEEEPRA